MVPNKTNNQWNQEQQVDNLSNLADHVVFGAPKGKWMTRVRNRCSRATLKALMTHCFIVITYKGKFQDSSKQKTRF